MPILTRQELYDLVWSTPMTKLADDFGLSDVGLAKTCERHRIPTAPRRYWAKKEAGKKVKQTIFVQVDDPLLDKVEIIASHNKLPDPVREIVEQRRVERKASIRPPCGRLAGNRILTPAASNKTRRGKRSRKHFSRHGKLYHRILADRAREADHKSLRPTLGRPL